MNALVTARRVSAVLFVAMLFLLLVAGLAHAQHSAHESVACYRAGANGAVIEEAVDPLTEHLRVRPSDYIRVVREGESVVYFGIGPLWCRAVRSEPE